MKQHVVWVGNNIDTETDELIEWERVSEWDSERDAKIQAQKLYRNGAYQTKVTEEVSI